MNQAWSATACPNHVRWRALGGALVATVLLMLSMSGSAHALSRFDGVADEHLGDAGGPWPAAVATNAATSPSLQSLFESTWAGNGGPVRYARMIIRYNAADLGEGCWADAVRFYQYAIARGLTPVVSFWRQGAGSDCHDGDYSTALPADANAYDTAIRHTIDGLQNATGVRPPYIEAWNEPNQRNGPNETLAAAFWAKAYYACGSGTSCTVIAGDFVDSKDGTSGTEAQQWCDASYASVATYETNYINALAALGLRPSQWGFHPYNAGRCQNSGTVTTLDQKLSAAGISHALWFTEVGAYRCQTSTGAYQDETGQAADAAWMTSTLIRLANVAHAFYYGLASGGPTPIDIPNICYKRDDGVPGHNQLDGHPQDSVLYSGDPSDGSYHARPAASAIFGPSNLTASTSAATDITHGSATLHGTINPGGISNARYYFQYGKTDSYGEGQTGAIGVGQGSANVDAASGISGLTPGANYHFRIIARNDDGVLLPGADQQFTTLETPTYMTVTADGVGQFQTQPWNASNWSAMATTPSDLMMATTRSGTTYAAAKSDPDGDGLGVAYYQASPFSANWFAIGNWVAQMALTTPVGGGAMITAVDSPSTVLYYMDTPFSPSGWQAIGNSVDRVAATAPKEGGTQIVARDKPSHKLYFMNSPYCASCWQALADSVDEVAVTSPVRGGTVVAATNENTHQAWFQASPYSATWTYLTNDVKHIYLTRGGNGTARVGVIKNDGSAYINNYPFPDSGWQRISPVGWNVTKLAMSGDSLAVIHDVSGNAVASFAQEPFPSGTFSASDWHDVHNTATDIGFDQRGL